MNVKYYLEKLWNYRTMVFVPSIVCIYQQILIKLFVYLNMCILQEVTVCLKVFLICNRTTFTYISAHIVSVLQLIYCTGQMVYSVRLQCGRELAREAPVDADIVSSVPESGTAAAHGYARQVCTNFILWIYKS